MVWVTRYRENHLVGFLCIDGRKFLDSSCSQDVWSRYISVFGVS